MDPLSYITLILAIATVGLAGTAVWSILQTRTMHQRELKIRLLDKVVEWVMDIQTSSLEINIPLTGGLEPEQEKTRIEANILLKYGIPFSRNEYIRAIASEAFEKELKSDVENTINTFTAFLFLKGETFILKDVKRAFGGTALSIIDEIEKQIQEGIKTSKQPRTEVARQVENEYSVALAGLTNNLLIKVGNITAKLLSS